MSISIPLSLLTERSVKLKFFNKDLGYFVLEKFYSDKSIRDSFLILISLEEYKNLFEEVDIGNILVSKCNGLISNHNTLGIEYLEYLIVYEESVNKKYTSLIEIKLSASSPTYKNCNFDGTIDGSLSNTNCTFNNSGSNLNSTLNNTFDSTGISIENKMRSNTFNSTFNTINGRESLEYLLKIFKFIKLQRIRMKVISESLKFIRIEEFSEFLVNCIFNDPNLLASLLSERSERRNWNPQIIFKSLISLSHSLIQLQLFKY